MEEPINPSAPGPMNVYQGLGRPLHTIIGQWPKPMTNHQAHNNGTASGPHLVEELVGDCVGVDVGSEMRGIPHQVLAMVGSQVSGRSRA